MYYLVLPEPRPDIKATCINKVHAPLLSREVSLYAYHSMYFKSESWYKFGRR